MRSERQRMTGLLRFSQSEADMMSKSHQHSNLSHGQRLKLQAMGRAFARVGLHNKNPQMLAAAQRLVSLSNQQPTEGPTMSEKQSDIAERLRVMADDLVLYKEIDTGADDMREAADEIERLRAALREILFEASTIQQAAEIARVALKNSDEA
jgi:hypothetical protein